MWLPRATHQSPLPCPTAPKPRTRAVFALRPRSFDFIAQGAEEARNPLRDVPLAVVISTLVCTALYAAAAAVLVGLVPAADVNPAAPFSAAFRGAPGYGWVSYVVSALLCVCCKEEKAGASRHKVWGRARVSALLTCGGDNAGGSCER